MAQRAGSSIAGCVYPELMRDSSTRYSGAPSSQRRLKRGVGVTDGSQQFEPCSSPISVSLDTRKESLKNVVLKSTELTLLTHVSGVFATVARPQRSGAAQ